MHSQLVSHATTRKKNHSKFTTTVTEVFNSLLQHHPDAAGGPANPPNSGGNTLIYDFTRENDFQAMLPPLDEIDINDPQNEHLLYLKSKRSVISDSDIFRLQGFDTISYFRGHGSSSFYTMMNYMIAKPSLRLQLLLIRSKKPYLFQNIWNRMDSILEKKKSGLTPSASTASLSTNQGYFPYHPYEIPFDEDVIKNSEFYKQILQTENLTSAQMLEALPTTEIIGKVSPNMLKQTSFITRVRNSQTALSFRAKKLKLVTSSVVMEADYTPQPLLLQLLGKIPRRRDLKPKVVIRMAQATEIQHCLILIQVVGARNVPLRVSNSSGSGGMTHSGSSGALDTMGGLAASGTGILGSSTMQMQQQASKRLLNEKKMLQKRRIRSFVEVKFQDHIIATGTLEGNTPMWKQSLSLPFHPPHMDFTPFALDQIRDFIYFTLFDEVIEDDASRGGYLEGETTFRIEKYYLGSFAIPFHTVYHEGKLDGIFRMDFPLFNFGYENPNLPVKGVGVGNAMAGELMLRQSSTGVLAQSGGLANVPSTSNLAPGSPGRGGRARSPTLEDLQQNQEVVNNTATDGDPDSPTEFNGRPLPSNRLVAGSRTFFNLLEYCFEGLYDSCTCIPVPVKDSIGNLYEYMKLPFQPMPPSRELLESLYYRTKYISNEALVRFSTFFEIDSSSKIRLFRWNSPIMQVMIGHPI
jgi:hypothetical protein